MLRFSSGLPSFHSRRCHRLHLLVVACVAGGMNLATARVAQARPLAGSRIEVNFPRTARALWTYAAPGSKSPIAFEAPSFPVGGKLVRAEVVRMAPTSPPKAISAFVTEHRFGGRLREDANLELELTLRVSSRSPFVRFRYGLRAREPQKLSRTPEGQNVSYFATSLSRFADVREVRLSEFVDIFHSYTLHEEPLGAWQFDGVSRAMGPLLVASDASESLALAYEHGSAVPHAFLAYHLEEKRNVRLVGVKGNIIPGQVIAGSSPYETLWFQVGSVVGNAAALAAAYRSFVLNDLTNASATRYPYVYYNTWNLQEREQLKTRNYLGVMTQERTLRDIEVAHRMGVDTYVIDIGWFSGAGDWEVHRERFPGGLKDIHEKLAGHGMKLGLWFDPVLAAKAGKAAQAHPNLRSSASGRTRQEDVEGIPSVGMCLVSAWADVFADRLIALHKETGATYFKLDGLRSQECDLPGHWHGNEAMTPQERLDAFGFLLPGALAHIAQKVVDEVPEAVVDLDLTEDARVAGLQYLTSGKFFLINNGPYIQDYDLPRANHRGSSNVFFNPGPARGWIARAPLTYDRWIPSVLFLTHFFPDDPLPSQMSSLGSLVLGGNGIWGDLQTVSPEGVARIGDVISRYKQVRMDMTEGAAVRTGALAGSPEVYEKLSPKTGKGAVVVFTTSNGAYDYVTRLAPAKTFWSTSNAQVKFRPDGRAHIAATLKKGETAIVFFGAAPAQAP